jgi:hypothetical protein
MIVLRTKEFEQKILLECELCKCRNRELKFYVPLVEVYILVLKIVCLTHRFPSLLIKLMLKQKDNRLEKSQRWISKAGIFRVVRHTVLSSLLSAVEP